MRITEQNISAHELVGLAASIIESSDPALGKLHGRIVYETKNLLILEEDDGNRKKVAKGVVTLSITLPDGRNIIVVRGCDLVGRPEDRIHRLR